MLHEFEAFLFCAPEKLDYVFPNESTKINQIHQISSQFSSPEEINNSPLTAPSKRLKSIFQDYDKPLHGCITIMNIGLAQIRAQCSHFDAWLRLLETL